MSVKVNRDLLRFWSGIVSKMLPSTKLSHPLHKDIVLDGDGKKLSLYANSELHALAVQVDYVGEEFKIAVDATSLHHACAGSQADVELNVEDVDDSPGVRVTNGEATFLIQTDDHTLFKFPTDESESGNDAFSPNCTFAKGDLVDLLSRSEPFFGKEITQPHLMGAYFTNEWLYATNRINAARFKHSARLSVKSEGAFEDMNFISVALLELLKTGGDDKDPVVIGLNSSWIEFELPAVTFFTRRQGMKGEFATAEIDRLVAECSSYKGKIKITPQNLSDALGRLSYFVSDALVRVVATRKKVTLEAFSGKRTLAKVDLNAVYNGQKELKILFDHGFLKVVSNLVDPFELQIGASEEDTVFVSYKGADFISLPAVI